MQRWYELNVSRINMSHYNNTSKGWDFDKKTLLDKYIITKTTRLKYTHTKYVKLSYFIIQQFS